MLSPEEYDEWRVEGMAMGFKYVASGPLVRSSYKAGEVFMSAILDERHGGSPRTPGAAGADAAAASPLPTSALWTPNEEEVREAQRALSRPEGACPL